MFEALRRLAIIAALALGPAPSAHALTQNEARALIYNGDVDGLEAAFVDVHASANAGDITEDDQRMLYRVFSVTDPRVHAAVRAWRDRHPGSIYAATAQLTVDWMVGWQLRGEATVRDTYPDAMELFGRHVASTRDLALWVLERDPLFLPASDALLSVAQAETEERPAAWAALERIMDGRPNHGTLVRGLGMTAPAWGGTWLNLVALCNAHAGKIRDVPRYSARICIVEGGILHGHNPERIAQVADRVGPFYGSVLEDHAAFDALVLRPDAPWAARTARDALDDPHFMNVRLARKYDEEIASVQGWTLMHATVQDRRRAWAREQLAHDPYNGDLIRYALDPEDGPNGPLPSPDPEADLEIAERALVFGRYDPRAWLDVGFRVGQLRFLDDPMAFEPYYVNAVVYGQYHPVYLRHLMRARYENIRIRRMLEGEGDQRDVTEEMRADYAGSALSRLPETRMICPLVADLRLYEASCAARGECRRAGRSWRNWTAVYEDAAVRNLCPVEMHGTVEELAYTPDASVIPTE